jgi:Holliday junction DNA helicase RuvA
MIAHLRGTVSKTNPCEVTVDVSGVGYKVAVPLTLWDELQDGGIALIHICTYVREDRFELFGFAETHTKKLFEELIQISGIGPRLGLELCAVPRSLLTQAINEEDPSILSSIKGIGRKTSEKLLVELRSLAEKYPHMFMTNDAGGPTGTRYDRDTIAALTQLGFATPEIMRVLESLPQNLASTEDRVTAALRSL